MPQRPSRSGLAQRQIKSTTTTLYEGFQNLIYKNPPLLFFSCSAGQITKTKTRRTRTMGAYAEVFLYRKSWQGALPSCATAERHAGADAARPGRLKGLGGCAGNTCECADAQGMFSLRAGPFVHVAWNVAVSGCVCLTQRHSGSWPTRSVTVWKYTGAVTPSALTRMSFFFAIYCLLSGRTWLATRETDCKKGKRPFCERLSGLVRL